MLDKPTVGLHYCPDDVKPWLVRREDMRLDDPDHLSQYVRMSSRELAGLVDQITPRLPLLTKLVRQELDDRVGYLESELVHVQGEIDHTQNVLKEFMNRFAGAAGGRVASPSARCSGDHAPGELPEASEK